MGEWGFLKDLALVAITLFASRWFRQGDNQNSAAVQQATIGTRLLAAEEWIKANGDIRAVVRELKKDMEALSESFDRLEGALRAVATSLAGNRFPQPQPEPATAFPPDVIAGLAMLSKIGKSSH